jgi:hypothetical protein
MGRINQGDARAEYSWTGHTKKRVRRYEGFGYSSGGGYGKGPQNLRSRDLVHPQVLEDIYQLRAKVVALGGSLNLCEFDTLPPYHRFPKSLAREMKRDLQREISRLLRQKAGEI